MNILKRHIWAIPLEIFMLGGVIVTIVMHDWLHVATSVFSILVSLMPVFAERLFRIKVPTALHTIFAAFVFASMFSGEVLRIYGIVPVWDDTMHFLSGFVVAPMVMLALVILRHRITRYYAPKWVEALFVTCVTLAVSIIWEVAEFASDQLFGTFSQGADLKDTMMDIIYGTFSSICMGLLWLYHLKTHSIPLLSPLLARTKSLNS